MRAQLRGACRRHPRLRLRWPATGTLPCSGWLVVVAAVNTVISLFYYLRWVGPVFRGAAPADTAAPEQWSNAAALTAAAASVAVGLGAGVVLAGVSP